MASPFPASSQAPRFRLGVDVGGTFTDLSIFDERSGEVAVYKTPSTPADPSRGIAEGIQALLAARGVAAGALSYLGHGTTVATNAMLEGRLARVGLITTRGFRDLLEIRRQKRPALYDLFFDQPTPLVRRHLRLEVTERLDAQGRVVHPLAEDEARAAVARLVAAGVDAIAVCYLYSFLEPRHERRTVEIVRELAPGLPTWASHEVLPEFREFERLSTTVTSAALGPVVGRYLGNFARRSRALGVAVRPYVAQSNGGIMSVEVARRRPANLLLSGPSAGVMGAVYVAGLAGFGDVITFDMGGTSTDVCLVEGGAPRVSTEREVAGYPVRVPMIDVHSIGAGGGSIAAIDSGGRLTVGPRSAGAVPGPACYGLGGTEPTVSDANVVLGRLNPERILGGRMAIDAAAARAAVRRRVAEPLELSLDEAALGIVALVDAGMVLATRRVSVERGYDPRDFTLVAFGGAGPLHAGAIARELSVPRVLVPEAPGILCALGLLATDLRTDYVRTVLLTVGRLEVAEVNDHWAALEQQARDWLAQEAIPPGRQVLQRSADVRYARQNYELAVPAPAGRWTEATVAALAARFHAEHERAYGYRAPEEIVQVINLRVTAYGRTPHVALRRHEPAGRALHAAQVAERPVLWARGEARRPTAIYARELLEPGHAFVGPAIVEQIDSTCLVAPGQRARVDAYRNLVVEEAGPGDDEVAP